MKNWQRYSEYQDSGIEWLGEIPKHWEVKKIKYILRLSYGDSLSSDIREDGDILVYGSNGIVGTHTKSNTLGPCIIVGRKGSCGKITYSENSAFAIDTTYFIDRTTTVLDITFRWLFYALSLLELDKSSQDTGVPGLNREFTHNRLLPLPASIEQKSIAHFLDCETSKLDTLIAKKQRFIELLQEKRTALISHAVTKGLNPDVPMKDSGIEWLGQIPKHWEVKKLKYLITEPLKYGANESAELNNKDCPRFIRITDISEDGTLREETFRSLPHDIAKPFILKAGDILFARSGATVGKTFMYSEHWGIACHAGYLIRARLKTSKAIPEFISYFANSSVYWDWISSIFIQATIQNVSAEKYANLSLAIPPLSEQKAIAHFLDQETAKIDTLIDKTKISIEKLKEYRTALISAAVTGKIDIREEVA